MSQELPATGNLHEQSFAAIVHRLFCQRFSGALILKDLDNWCHVYFAEGSPVFIESNQVDETLGRELVSLQKISEVERQQLLLKAMSTGEDFAALLIEANIITPAQLFEMLRRNYTARLLSLFAWQTAEYSLQPGKSVPSQVLTLKISVPQLLLEGISSYMPRPLLLRQLHLHANAAFSLTGKNHYKLQATDMSVDQVQLVKLIKQGMAYHQLKQSLNVPEEVLQRWLLALQIMELVQESSSTASGSDGYTLPGLATEADATSETPINSSMGHSIEEFTNRLTKKYLLCRSQSFFELFEIASSAAPEEIDRAYIKLLADYHPFNISRQNHLDIVSKAEELLTLAARAYVVLSSPELRRSYIKRIENSTVRKES